MPAGTPGAKHLRPAKKRRGWFPGWKLFGIKAKLPEKQVVDGFFGMKRTAGQACFQGIFCLIFD